MDDIAAQQKAIDERIGKCYSLSFEYQQKHPSYTLVHGMLAWTRREKPDYKHAWLEKDGVVFDPVLGEKFDKKHYYDLFKATPVNTYSRQDATRYMIYYCRTSFWRRIPKTDSKLDSSRLSEDIIEDKGFALYIWSKGKRRNVDLLIKKRIVQPHVILRMWKEYQAKQTV